MVGLEVDVLDRFDLWSCVLDCFDLWSCVLDCIAKE